MTCHTFTHTVYTKPGSETPNCTGTKSQIAILMLTEASACGKIKDRTESQILHRRMSSNAGSRLRTDWHRWDFLPTEIWAQLYNPLHPKVQAFVCWLQNCRVVQSLHMSSQCCNADAFLIIRKKIADSKHNIITCCSLSTRQILTAICQVQLQIFKNSLQCDEFRVNSGSGSPSHSLFLQNIIFFLF